MSRVESSIDFCLRKSGSTLVMSGWLKGSDSLSAGSAGADLSCRFWARPDVDALYGPCLEAGKSGYGFLGVGVNPDKSATIPVFAPGKDAPLLMVEPADYADVPAFIRAIMDLPLPWEERFELFGLVGNNLKADASYPTSNRELILGKVCADPENSLIISAFHDNEAAIRQTLAFSLDESLREKNEIIYVASYAEAETLHAIAQGNELFATPLRMIICQAVITPAEAWNIGASWAKGGTLIFTEGNVIHEWPGWLLPLGKELAANGKFICYGPENRFKKAPALPAADMKPIVCKENPRLEKLLTGTCEASLLAVRRDAWVMTGGFDCRFMTASGALTDLAFRLGNGPVKLEDNRDLFMAVYKRPEEGWQIALNKAIWDLALSCDR